MTKTPIDELAAVRFKMVYEVGGAHVHIKLYAGKKSGSLGYAGRFSLRREEWAMFQGLFVGAGNVEFEDVNYRKSPERCTKPDYEL